MSNKKKVIAFAFGALLIGVQFVFSHVLSYAGGEKVTKIALGEDYDANLAISDNRYDGTGITEVDISKVKSNSDAMNPVQTDSPIIIETIVEKNAATELQQFDFGIVANDSVKLYVTAKSDTKSPIEFTLSDGQTVTVSECEEVMEDTENGQIIKYVYIAEFDEELGKGEENKDITLTCVLDNGTESSPLPVQMKLADSEETTTRLILDQKEPEITDMKVSYDNAKKEFAATGNIIDRESGIKSVRFKWDAQEWQTYEVSTNQPNINIQFEDSVLYRNSQNVTDGKGMHMLYFEITDNAGIIYEENSLYCDAADGPDEVAPAVTFIKLEAADGTTLDDALRSLSFGNFSNKELVLKLKVVDQSQSDNFNGVGRIELLDGASDDAKVIEQLEGKNDNDYIYTFAIKPEQIINKWYIRVSDTQGCSEIKSVSNLLKNYESDKWIFDSVKPQIEIVYDGEKFQNGTHYFNNEGGKVIFNISDVGGLEKTAIVQTFETTDKILKEEIYTNETHNFSYEVDTSTLETGWYTYTVIAEDFASNSEANRKIKIYVDHEKPEGMITVVSPAVTKIGDEIWVREKDDSGEILPITFRLYAEQKGAALYKLSLNINGEHNHFEFSAAEFKSDANKKTYVDVTVSSDNLPYNESHIYEVYAIIEAESHNEGYTSFKLHVDTENPAIDRFSVGKKNAEEGTILNVLEFGVFANDSIRLTVDVRDGDLDSGVEKVDIKYEGLEEAEPMVKLSEGKYYYDLEIGTQVFQSDIVVTVYDKVGKHSLSCPNIENTDRDKGVSDNCFVMLETIEPMLIVDLPETDSVKREDGKIWYRRHTNSDNDSEKIIELMIQDVDSGVRQVEMMVNGQSIGPISSELDRNHVALPTIESTEAIGKSNRKDLCKQFHFYYSTESIAANIPPNEDGSYVIEIKVIDNAGNVNFKPVDKKGNTYAESKIVYYRDVSAPSVTGFSFEPASYDGISEVNQEQFIETLEYGYYFKNEFDVVLAAEDSKPSSQLDTAIFRLVPYENGDIQKEETYSVPIVDGKAVCSIRDGFKGQVFGKVYDKVNNVSNERTPRGFIVDGTAPIITIEPLPASSPGRDNNNNKLFTDTVQFRVTISDTKSGLRTITYSKSSERDSYNDVITEIDNIDGYNGSSVLANGWQITGSDANLVTEVSQIFTFSDDNDISMTFGATDRSGNKSNPQTSETFTIDTIAPQITINNGDTIINDRYYRDSTAFTITVTERNFSQELMVSKIENSFTNASPEVLFQTDNNNTSIHTAIVTFPEGDYEFDFSGSDLGGHRASISVNGGAESEYFSTTFNVDATAPKIRTNFSDFGNDDDAEVYFNEDQIAEIIVTEHNFDDSDMGIEVMEKASGAVHTADGEGWYSVGYTSAWKDDGDTHTLQIPFDKDGIYRIIVSPKDRAENPGEFVEGSPDHTTVYEIDKTPPEFYARNEQLATEKGFVKTPFYDVYDEKRKDEEPPTVEFRDINFDRIEVDTIVYTPMYENGMELGDIVISPISEVLSQPVTSNKFTLPEFEKDGVYALTFVAVDKAGNRSEAINNTYFHMIDTDVLAYIYNSNIKDNTGYYSLMSTEGKAKSKKATDFEDLDILVIKPIENKEAGALVIREDEELHLPTEYAGFTVENDNISETAMLMRMHLPGEYFSETFKDDSLDTRMYLSVSARDGVYLDLASIHIDNEAPTATIPDGFKNWHNFLGEEVTIVLTNVSETLDDTASVVYECPGNGARGEKIPHLYNPEEGTYSFTLGKGLHHIDITLVDEAGNEWNVDRVKYLRVGNFRIYLVITMFLVGVIVLLLWRRKKLVI